MAAKSLRNKSVNPEKLLDAHRRYLDEWIEQPSNREILYAQSIANIEENLEKKNDRKSVISLTERIENAATYLVICGAHAILYGDLSGWQDIQRGLYYRALHWRLNIDQHRADPKRWKFLFVLVYKLFRSLSFAFILKERAVLAWAIPEIARLLKEDSIGETGRSPFGPLLVKLYELQQGQPLVLDDVIGRRLGPYRSIFEHWKDNEGLAEALRGACDYHVSRIDTPANEDEIPEPEFAGVPYNISPIDILAILRVREELGLSTPAFEHILMRGPLAKLPASLPPPFKNAIHDKVAARIEEYMQKGEQPTTDDTPKPDLKVIEAVRPGPGKHVDYALGVTVVIDEANPVKQTIRHVNEAFLRWLDSRGKLAKELVMAYTASPKDFESILDWTQKMANQVTVHEQVIKNMAFKITLIDRETGMNKEYEIRQRR